MGAACVDSWPSARGAVRRQPGRCRRRCAMPRLALCAQPGCHISPCCLSQQRAAAGGLRHPRQPARSSSAWLLASSVQPRVLAHAVSTALSCPRRPPAQPSPNVCPALPACVCSSTAAWRVPPSGSSAPRASSSPWQCTPASRSTRAPWASERRTALCVTMRSRTRAGCL